MICPSCRTEGPRAIYGEPGQGRSHCSRCRIKGVHINLNKKRCVICNAQTPFKEVPRASFGPPGGPSVRCKLHKIAGKDICIGGQYCIKCERKKRALFADIDGNVAVYCAVHRPTDFKRIGKDNCVVCNKVAATFGSKDDYIALRCKEHSLQEDIDVVSARCERCFSGVRPIFGLPGETVGSWCARCKIDGTHVDVHNPMCVDCGEHHAIYGLSSDKIRLYCRACSENRSGQFECVVLKKCQECDKCAQKDGLCKTCHPDYVPTIKGCSKAACFYFDALELELGVSIQHTHFDRTTGEWKRDEYNSKRVSGYSPIDGFIEESKTVIEFEGDVFHGHPRLWQQDADAKNYFGVPYRTLYENTEKKLQKYLSAGYRVQYVWEHDVMQRKRALQSFGSLLRTFDGRLQPRPALETEQTTNKRKAIEEPDEHLTAKKAKINV